MRLCEIDPTTCVAVYDCQTGTYLTLGTGFSDSDDARRAAEAEVSGEFVLVAELATIDERLDAESDRATGQTDA